GARAGARNGGRGLGRNLEEHKVGAAILGHVSEIREGGTARRPQQIAWVPVGKALLGRVVNALGEPLDGKGPINATETRRLEIKAPGIVKRKSVHQPLETGIKALDALGPIGRRPRGPKLREPPTR